MDEAAGKRLALIAYRVTRQYSVRAKSVQRTAHSIHRAVCNALHVSAAEQWTAVCAAAEWLLLHADQQAAQDRSARAVFRMSFSVGCRPYVRCARAAVSRRKCYSAPGAGRRCGQMRTSNSFEK